MTAVTKPAPPASMPLRFPALLIRHHAGTSFKHAHLTTIVADATWRGFFEVHAENDMGSGGPPHRALEAIRRDHPAMAFLSGCGEILFPLLLVLGVATRFAAFGLLVMTLILQLTVPDGWPIHITWVAMSLGILAWGPGRLSIDDFLHRRFRLTEGHR